jgi:hypothetical protein
MQRPYSYTPSHVPTSVPENTVHRPKVEYLGPLPVPPEDIPENLKQPTQKPVKPISEYSDEELYQTAGIKPPKKPVK